MVRVDTDFTSTNTHEVYYSRSVEVLLAFATAVGVVVVVPVVASGGGVEDSIQPRSPGELLQGQHLCHPAALCLRIASES